MSTPFRPLEPNEILDAGYGEFWTTPADAEELLNGGMTHINGVPVTLAVVDRMPAINAVAIRWTAADTIKENAEGTYDWQMAEAA